MFFVKEYSILSYKSCTDLGETKKKLSGLSNWYSVLKSQKKINENISHKS